MKNLFNIPQERFSSTSTRAREAFLKKFLLTTFVLCLLIGFSLPCSAQEINYPSSKGYVNDYADILSAQTAQEIDKEVRNIVDMCYSMAKTTLTDNKEKLIKLAEKLIEREVLDVKEVMTIIGIEDAKQ